MPTVPPAPPPDRENGPTSHESFLLRAFGVSWQTLYHLSWAPWVRLISTIVVFAGIYAMLRVLP